MMPEWGHGLVAWHNEWNQQQFTEQNISISPYFACSIHHMFLFIFPMKVPKELVKGIRMEYVTLS